MMTISTADTDNQASLWNSSISRLSRDIVTRVVRRDAVTQGKQLITAASEKGYDYLDETECAPRQLFGEEHLHAKL